MEIAPADDSRASRSSTLSKPKLDLPASGRYMCRLRLQPTQLEEIRSHALNAYRRLGCRYLRANRFSA